VPYSAPQDVAWALRALSSFDLLKKALRSAPIRHFRNDREIMLETDAAGHGTLMGGTEEAKRKICARYSALRT